MASTLPPSRGLPRLVDCPFFFLCLPCPQSSKLTHPRSFLSIGADFVLGNTPPHRGWPPTPGIISLTFLRDLASRSTLFLKALPERKVSLHDGLASPVGDVRTCDSNKPSSRQTPPLTSILVQVEGLPRLFLQAFSNGSCLPHRFGACRDAGEDSESFISPFTSM